MNGAARLTLLFDECVDCSLAVPAFAPIADLVFIRDTMPRADDNAILAFARAHDHVLVTEDAGFGRLIFQLRLPPPPGAILIALDPMQRTDRPAHLKAKAIEAMKAAQGAFVTIGPKNIRRRALPADAG